MFQLVYSFLYLLESRRKNTVVLKRFQADILFLYLLKTSENKSYMTFSGRKEIDH